MARSLKLLYREAFESRFPARFSYECANNFKGGHNQIQHTIRPRQRNCFTTVSHYDVPGQTRALGTKLKCAVCNWEFIVDWKTFKRPTLDGRGIPIEVIWQRFHYRQDHRSMFRCFICRDGETFGWKNLKNHFREKHTYTEICG